MLEFDHIKDPRAQQCGQLLRDPGERESGGSSISSWNDAEKLNVSLHLSAKCWRHLRDSTYVSGLQ